MLRLRLLHFALPAATALAGCGGSSKAGPARPVAPAAPVAPAVRLSAARVNGTLLYYRLAGDTGTPVVFIHGSLGDLTDWNAQIADFAATHRVLVYSRRYHRPNPPQEDHQVYSPQLHAADLAVLLETLQIGPAHIVGSSYGAYAALALALEHPQMIRSLVLGEPPVLPLLLRTPAGDSLRRAFEAATLDAARAAFARGDSVGGLRRFLDGLSGTPGRFDRLPAPARAVILAQAFEARRELLADPRVYLPPVACADLRRVAAPVLLLQGQRSPPMYHVITEELARCLHSDTLITIPGAGHDIHASQAPYYNDVVRRYLATH